MNRLEAETDRYEDAIGTYLVQLSNRSMNLADSHMVNTLLHTISDFERISDHARDLVQTADEIRQKKIVFSSPAQKELQVLELALSELLSITVSCFREKNLSTAHQVEPLDSLENEFRQDIEQIQALQPEAVIYLLQVYGVSREKAAAVSYLTPEHLQEINAMIASLCDGTQVRCLDPRPLYEDEAGYLIAEYTGDGVHPYGKYDALLSQWLCRQAG